LSFQVSAQSLGRGPARQHQDVSQHAWLERDKATDDSGNPASVDPTDARNATFTSDDQVKRGATESEAAALS
jgi:hypothetical protein